MADQSAAIAGELQTATDSLKRLIEGFRVPRSASRPGSIDNDVAQLRQAAAKMGRSSPPKPPQRMAAPTAQREVKLGGGGWEEF
jgi:methyl-accepting chemotaxis protein